MVDLRSFVRKENSVYTVHTQYTAFCLNDNYYKRKLPEVKLISIVILSKAGRKHLVLEEQIETFTE